MMAGSSLVSVNTVYMFCEPEYGLGPGPEDDTVERVFQTSIRTRTESLCLPVFGPVTRQGPGAARSLSDVTHGFLAHCCPITPT